MGYSLAHVDDIEPGGPGGAVRFVRRELGVEAFGINWFELPPNVVGHEHDESDSGQEEVNVVIRGSGTYRVEGVDVPVRAGTFIRFDPGTTRVAIAGPGRDDDDRGRRAAGELRAARPVLRVLVRLLIWNVADSQTTIDELRDVAPRARAAEPWIWNEVSERFGVMAFGDELPESVGWAQDLVGGEPDVYEEFDS